MSNLFEDSKAAERQRLTSDSGGNSSFSSDTSTTSHTLVPPSSPSALSNMGKCGKHLILSMGSEKAKPIHRCTINCLSRYPIHHAARLGKFPILKQLLDQYSKNKNADGDTNQEGQEEQVSNAEPIKVPVKLNCGKIISVPAQAKICPLEKDECLGRTPLHYAAMTGNVEKGLLCTRLLLECSAFTVDAEKRTEKLRKFVNAVDHNHETALHLAASNEATKIVRELLLNQADLDIKSNSGKCCLMEVYKKTPMAMSEALNQSISYVELCKREMCDEEVEEKSKRKSSGDSDEIDLSQSYVDVCLNFYPLLGSEVSTGRGKKGRPIPETTFLYKINRKRMENDVRRQILNNVLVQAFLHFKWGKIRSFCFMAIFMHIVWLALYIGIVIDVFVINCPYVTQEERDANNDDKNNDRIDRNETDLLSDPATNLQDQCVVGPTIHMAAALLLIFSVGITIKELFQFIRLRSLYVRFENFGQCTLLTFIFVSVPNLYLYNESVIDPLHFQLSAFGIFLAWTLFLCQLAKLPRFCMHFSCFGIRGHIILPDHGLYVEILSRVFKNFLIFITIFSSLLISFVFSFNILLPNSTGFINLSNSVLKVLTMMTGELNYDDIFHSEDEKLIYPVSSHVMYAIFIMVATIILFNLLIGFTVSDIQGLQKDAEVTQISNKLEQIFLMECFLLSAPMQIVLRLYGKIFGRSGSQNDALRNIMVTRRTTRHTWLCYHTKIKQLPVKHRVEIRDWAAKNCLSITDISGVIRGNFFQSSFTRH